MIGGIDFSKLTCNPGDELDVVLCYPKCRAGFTPLSFLCWSTCNQTQDPVIPTINNEPNLITSGDDWIDNALVCRKRLYDRGVGTIPDGCSDSDRQIFMGMCYKTCNSGYSATTWAPTTCSQSCPQNTVEGGFANCTKVNSYGRGGGNWGNGCPSGYSNMGLYCYKWIPADGRGFDCPNNCSYVPYNGTDGYGRSGNCGSAPTLQEITDGGKQMYTDGRGARVSSVGCYVDSNNTGSWLPVSEPQYYRDGKFPSWYTGPNGLPGSNIPTPPGVSDANYNSRRSNFNDTNCEENWGSLCYPKCDVGFINAGCCICSPSCGGLRDDGATCHRDWYDRGVGKVPDGCSDFTNKTYTEGLCYTRCKDNFVSFATTCTKSGCPYGSINETALTCQKSSYYRGPGTIAVPAVGDKLNSKINIGALSEGAEQLAFNGVIIVICLIVALVIFSTNILLRSKNVKKIK